MEEAEKNSGCRCRLHLQGGSAFNLQLSLLGRQRASTSSRPSFSAWASEPARKLVTIRPSRTISTPLWMGSILNLLIEDVKRFFIFQRHSSPAMSLNCWLLGSRFFVVVFFSFNKSSQLASFGILLLFQLLGTFLFWSSEGDGSG